jgi:putative flavoprotein involved in K+ transport
MNSWLCGLRRPAGQEVYAMEHYDTVIVGAGHSGLGVSYYLQRDRRPHVVFERGRIGESWLTQRWDSFTLNSLNYINVLPGLAYNGPEPDGFWQRDDLVQYFQRYVKDMQLPVQTGVTVISVERAKDQESFVVKTQIDGQGESSVSSRSVVIASGFQRTPKIPQLASSLPADITQLHTSEYRNEATLPPGAIVVVGSGQSGCQIAEELVSAGRTVYLCTSKVGRAPRRYRGRDLLAWWIDMKVLDVTFDSLEDKSVSRAAQPQISGLGRHGHTISLQHLARQGAVILGRLQEVDSGALVLGDDAAANLRFADAFSQQLKDGIDRYLDKSGLTPPPREEDPADAPDPHASCISPLRRLNLHEAKISTVIWATGFTTDLGWIHLPILDAQGKPIHQRGASPVSGVYFIGMPWLHSRKSGLIYGVDEDAHYIADAISAQLA